MSLGKKSLFLTGLFVLYIAMGTPLMMIGHHYLFSAHMFQQSLLFFVVPPLILLGTPDWLVRPLFKWSVAKRLVSYPWISVIIFNMLLSFYHYPIIFEFSLTNSTFGTSIHSLIFIASFMMWWAITCPVSELDTLSELKKMAYIVVNALLLYPACVFIIFSKSILYTSYAHSPRIFAILTLEDDQQLGGVIMKIMQEGVQIVSLAWIFYHWYRRENKEDGIQSFSYGLR